MRALSLIVLCAQAFTSGAVMAAPIVAQVHVAIGPDLAKKTSVMDAREFDYLKRELQRTVERKLKSEGALRPEGGALKLVIEDAVPNRPTLQEMNSRPGLSYSSFSVGGARISGEYRAPSGDLMPVAYSWYETDIRKAPYSSTWTDANIAFDRLADRLAKDKFDDR